MSSEPTIPEPVISPSEVRTGTCAYCGGRLGPDTLYSQPTPSDSAEAFCCYGCRWLGENRPAQPIASDLQSSHHSWFKVGLGTVLASQSMVVGLALNLSPPEGSARAWLHGILLVSAVATLIALGPPLLRASWDCACRRRIGIELLFLSGLLGAFGASVWSTFTGTGAIYYEIVAILLTVFTLGKTLTARARERAITESRRLSESFASARIRSPDGSVSILPIDQVAPESIAHVHAGEPIPVDGIILEGQSFVRETPLSGEPHPVVRRPGDTVLAGSFSVDGNLVIRVQSHGHTRRLDDLLAAVEASRNDLAGIESQARADRLAAWFLPIVLATSLTTFLFWGLRGEWMPGLFNALAVLLVACPCALGLATPLAVWNTLAQLAARGFVVRRPANLERLASLHAIAFDKTGTLTEDRASLIDFTSTSNAPPRATLLQWLAQIQSRAHHPISRAFTDSTYPYTQKEPPLQSVSIKTHPGSGIEAWVKTISGSEHRIRLGHHDWVRGHPNTESLRSQLKANPSDQHVLVEIDGHLVGMAAVRERLRDSTQQTLAELQKMGLAIEILTGDTSQRAAALLPESSSNIQSRLSPIDKALALQQLRRRHGSVGFVGDGINDAPALRDSDFSIALDSGAPLATATADAVLCGGNLRELPLAIRSARAMHQSIQGNLWFAALYNLVGMALAACGKLHPVAAALLMVGSSSVVAWRSLRPSDACSIEPSTETPPELPHRSTLRWILVGSCALQIPLLAHLGNLGPWPMALTGTVILVLGVFAAWLQGFQPRLAGPQKAWMPAAQMCMAMIGPGNLGMLIGWWADAGFGPVMREGVCLCCQSRHYFQVGAGIPWMHVGMLALGLPMMWRELPRIGFLGGRLGSALVSCIAMLLGMSFGADVLLKAFGPLHPHQFLVAFTGMTIGMLAAMCFACAALQALAIAGKNPAHKSAGRDR